MRPEALREAGRLPMFSSAISERGVAVRKYSLNLGVSYTSDRYALKARPESVSITARNAGASVPASASRSVASSVAATIVSRLRRPISRSEYLLAITSPCSVMRICPLTAPVGWARIAW
jgi:hypothetical protein